MVIIRNGQNEKLSQLPKPVKRAYSLGRIEKDRGRTYATD